MLDMEKSSIFTKDMSDSLFAFRTFGGDPVVRLCVGFMRMFDFLDIDDRVMIVGEFYFNQIGDGGNSFEEYRVGALYDSIMELPGGESIKQQAGIALLNGFEFNSLSKYYGAFFVTFNRFLITDMTLQLNGLVNFNHGCAMLTTGLQYRTLHNFSIGCLVTGFIGPEESEYTFMNNGASVRLTAGVYF